VNHDDEKGVELVPTLGSDLRGAAGEGQPPTTVVQQTTVAAPPKGVATDRGPSGTSVASQKEATVTETVTVPLRERLRAALRRHIDPDDDTMPALDCGGFVWVPVDQVLDDLVRALNGPDPAEAIARVAAAMDTPSGPPDEPTSEYGIGWDTAMDLVKKALGNHQPPGQRYPITTHAYQGERFLHPCTAIGYGSMCGATEWDHEERP